MAELSGEDLTCVRAERVVFRSLSFRLSAGGALVLTGANGSGKSSLLRLLAGLLRPATGRLCWDGCEVRDDPEAHRRRIRWLGHADGIKATLTAAENLLPWAVLWGGGRNAVERVDEALDAFGIARLADVPARYLSAGQRRRLALSRLLLVPGVVWLLDEPRTALDSDAVSRLDRVIARHRAAGGLVVMALHGEGAPPDADVLTLGPTRGEA